MKKTQAVTIAGTILLGALLFGAQHAAAAPPVPVGPTDIALPTAPPPPDPCEVKHIVCDITLPTAVTDFPTDVVNPTEPTEPTEPTDPTEPTEPTEPSDPVTTTQPQPTATGTATATNAPAGEPQAAPVPRPNRIDTGAGPADPVTWWLIAVPALAVLAMAAAGAFLWIQRTERRPS